MKILPPATHSIRVGAYVRTHFPSWVPLKRKLWLRITGQLKEFQVLGVQMPLHRNPSILIAMPDGSLGPMQNGKIWIDLSNNYSLR